MRDISYASPEGGRVPGYLILPPGHGRHPAVIYMHGLGATLSGGASPLREYALAAPPRLRARITRALGSVDPLRYVRRAAPSALLFQGGRRDQVVPRKALLALARAGSRPKEVRWYGAGHGLNEQAYRDQLRWLSQELGLDGPVVPGALAGLRFRQAGPRPGGRSRQREPRSRSTTRARLVFVAR